MKRRVILCVIVCAVLIFFASGISNAAQIEYSPELTNVYNQDTNQMNILYDSITGKSSLTNWIGNELNKIVGATLEKKYVPDFKEQLSVRNQLIDGVDTKECWALSFSSAIEAFNYVKDSDDKEEVYSARHVNLSCNNVFSDKTVNENRFNRNAYTAGGGNLYLATVYATSGYGPVLEEDMPSNQALNKIRYSELNTKNGVQKQLEGIENYPSIYKFYDRSGNITYYNQFDYNGRATSIEELEKLYTGKISSTDLKNFRNKVKNQIKENGSVVSYIFQLADGSYDINYKVQSSALNGQIVRPNHAVLIIGWDDEYKGENWENPGAYIALNSYGEDEFDNGYVYISYDDFYVEQSLVGITEMSDVDYSNIYEYDELGCNSNYNLSFDYSNISAVNVFNRETTKTEKLKEVGVYSYCEQIGDIYYTESFDSDNMPKDFKLVASNQDLQTGFTTIKLQKDINLTNKKFAVCVKYKSKVSGKKPTIAVEAPASVTGEDIFENVVTRAGESYLVYTADDASFDSSADKYFWTEMYLLYNQNTKIYLNAGIKAYTSDAEKVEEDPKITSSEYKIENKMITRVPVNTTMATFKSKISVTGSYKILDANNKEVSTKLVRTGYKVKVGSDTYEISVISDISGSGGDSYSRALDLAKMRAHIISLRGSILTGVKLEAADINGDGDVSAVDLAKLRSLSVE